MAVVASSPGITVQELVGYLAGALGEAKAQEIVTDTLRVMKVAPGALSKDQVLAVLEQIASHPGLVGITAHFVRSRLLLQS
jgi:hypothetical protein